MSTDYEFADDRLRREAERALTAFERQQAALPDVVAQLAALRSQASSVDGLVTVTVNAAGIVVDVQLAADAFRRSSPAKLGRSIAEAAARSAHLAQQQSAAVTEPLLAATSDLPDVSELIPGAESLRDLRESLMRDLDTVRGASNTDSRGV
ncbi:YbaB/EbfC family nucleoid-associated protein [Nocardia sp. NPDC050793]|uniref:YbaB/EbfC family nucleoid-associated protein n=1 Tax=Nocardia sp. NPDC050793 TaxID=3155159 RepID=UPI0033F9A65E